DKEEIRGSQQFPYQYLAAYLNADDDLPGPIKSALGRAAEVACGVVPELPGPVVIGLDVSGSMQYPVTGFRRRAGARKVRCVAVPALFAAAVLRRNPGSLLVPFDTQAHRADVDPEAPILDLAARLASYGGGGTNCSLPLVEANRNHRDRRLAGCV